MEGIFRTEGKLRVDKRKDPVSRNTMAAWNRGKRREKFGGKHLRLKKARGKKSPYVAPSDCP